MIVANRVIFYLYSIKNLTIEYFEIRISDILLCASDAVFADNEAIRKSSNDYLFQLYEEFIDWRAAKQITMITSSIETELLILSHTVKEAIWWKRFFEAVQFDSMKKVRIRCDNRQIIKVLNKELLKLNIKFRHVNIHRHWLRQKVQNDRIDISWISIADMSADEFIKSLLRQKHEKFLKQLNMRDISDKIHSRWHESIFRYKIFLSHQIFVCSYYQNIKNVFTAYITFIKSTCRNWYNKKNSIFSCHWSSRQKNRFIDV
jgi:hypothetical protein